MNIIKTDADNLSITADLLPSELYHFIEHYDKNAGKCLRENDLEGAMRWVDRAKEIKEQQDIARGKTNQGK